MQEPADRSPAVHSPAGLRSYATRHRSATPDKASVRAKFQSPRAASGSKSGLITINKGSSNQQPSRREAQIHVEAEGSGLSAHQLSMLGIILSAGAPTPATPTEGSAATAATTQHELTPARGHPASKGTTKSARVLPVPLLSASTEDLELSLTRELLGSPATRAAVGDGSGLNEGELDAAIYTLDRVLGRIAHEEQHVLPTAAPAVPPPLYPSTSDDAQLLAQQLMMAGEEGQSGLLQQSPAVAAIAANPAGIASTPARRSPLGHKVSGLTPSSTSAAKHRRPGQYSAGQSAARRRSRGSAVQQRMLAVIQSAAPPQQQGGSEAMLATTMTSPGGPPPPTLAGSVTSPPGHTRGAGSVRDSPALSSPGPLVGSSRRQLAASSYAERTRAGSWQPQAVAAATVNAAESSVDAALASLPSSVLTPHMSSMNGVDRGVSSLTLGDSGHTTSGGATPVVHKLSTSGAAGYSSNSTTTSGNPSQDALNSSNSPSSNSKPSLSCPGVVVAMPLPTHPSGAAVNGAAPSGSTTAGYSRQRAGSGRATSSPPRAQPALSTSLTTSNSLASAVGVPGAAAAGGNGGMYSSTTGGPTGRSRGGARAGDGPGHHHHHRTHSTAARAAASAAAAAAAWGVGPIPAPPAPTQAVVTPAPDVAHNSSLAARPPPVTSAEPEVAAPPAHITADLVTAPEAAPAVGTQQALAAPATSPSRASSKAKGRAGQRSSKGNKAKRWWSCFLCSVGLSSSSEGSLRASTDDAETQRALQAAATAVVAAGAASDSPIHNPLPFSRCSSLSMPNSGQNTSGQPSSQAVSAGGSSAAGGQSSGGGSNSGAHGKSAGGEAGGKAGLGNDADAVMRRSLDASMSHLSFLHSLAAATGGAEVPVGATHPEAGSAAAAGAATRTNASGTLALPSVDSLRAMDLQDMLSSLQAVLLAPPGTTAPGVLQDGAPAVHGSTRAHPLRSSNNYGGTGLPPAPRNTPPPATPHAATALASHLRSSIVGSAQIASLGTAGTNALMRGGSGLGAHRSLGASRLRVSHGREGGPRPGGLPRVALLGGVSHGAIAKRRSRSMGGAGAAGTAGGTPSRFATTTTGPGSPASNRATPGRSTIKQYSALHSPSSPYSGVASPLTYSPRAARSPSPGASGVPHGTVSTTSPGGPMPRAWGSAVPRVLGTPLTGPRGVPASYTTLASPRRAYSASPPPASARALFGTTEEVLALSPGTDGVTAGCVGTGTRGRGRGGRGRPRAQTWRPGGSPHPRGTFTGLAGYPSTTDAVQPCCSRGRSASVSPAPPSSTRALPATPPSSGLRSKGRGGSSSASKRGGHHGGLSSGRALPVMLPQLRLPLSPGALNSLNSGESRHEVFRSYAASLSSARSSVNLLPYQQHSLNMFSTPFAKAALEAAAARPVAPPPTSPAAHKGGVSNGVITANDSPSKQHRGPTGSFGSSTSATSYGSGTAQYRAPHTGPSPVADSMYSVSAWEGGKDGATEGAPATVAVRLSSLLREAGVSAATTQHTFPSNNGTSDYSLSYLSSLADIWAQSEQSHTDRSHSPAKGLTPMVPQLGDTPSKQQQQQQQQAKVSVFAQDYSVWAASAGHHQVSSHATAATAAAAAHGPLYMLQEQLMAAGGLDAAFPCKADKPGLASLVRYTGSSGGGGVPGVVELTTEEVLYSCGPGPAGAVHTGNTGGTSPLASSQEQQNRDMGVFTAARSSGGGGGASLVAAVSQLLYDTHPGSCVDGASGLDTHQQQVEAFLTHAAPPCDSSGAHPDSAHAAAADDTVMSSTAFLTATEGLNSTNGSPVDIALAMPPTAADIMATQAPGVSPTPSNTGTAVSCASSSTGTAATASGTAAQSEQRSTFGALARRMLGLTRTRTPSPPSSAVNTAPTGGAASAPAGTTGTTATASHRASAPTILMLAAPAAALPPAALPPHSTPPAQSHSQGGGSNVQRSGAWGSAGGSSVTSDTPGHTSAGAARGTAGESAGASSLLLVYKGSLTPHASMGGLAPPVELLNGSTEGLHVPGVTALTSSSPPAAGATEAEGLSAASIPGEDPTPADSAPELVIEASLAPDSDTTFDRSPDPTAHEQEHSTSSHAPPSPFSSPQSAAAVPAPATAVATAPEFSVLSSFPHIQLAAVAATSMGGSSVTSSGTGVMSDNASHSVASSMGGALAMSTRGSGASAYAMRPRSPAHPAGTMSPTPRSQQLRAALDPLAAEPTDWSIASLRQYERTLETVQRVLQEEAVEVAARPGSPAGFLN